MPGTLDNPSGNTGGGTAPSSEQYAQWAQQSAALAAQIAEAKKKRDALMSQTGCKKPLIMAGAKKTAYLNCLANYKAKVEAAKQADRDLIKMQLEMKRLDALQNKGLSTGAWIVISVGAALLLTTAVVVIVKMNKQ